MNKLTVILVNYYINESFCNGIFAAVRFSKSVAVDVFFFKSASRNCQLQVCSLSQLMAIS